MYARPSAPLSIGGVIDDGIRLYRASFAQCWRLSLVYSVLLGALTLALMLSDPMRAMLRKPDAQTLLALYRSPPFLLTYLTIGLAGLYTHGALLAQQSALARGDAASSPVAAVALAWRRLPAMILGGILSVLAVVVGTVLLVVPGIVIWGRLQLWIAAMFAEDLGATDSLARSWQLIKGHWWRSSTVFAVALIMIYILALIVGVVSTVITSLWVHDYLQSEIIKRVLTAASSVFLTPALPAIWLAMYQDLKLRREGDDLAARVGALSNA